MTRLTVRRFGIALLLLLVLGPLLLVGVLVTTRARSTALAEVKRGNERVAATVAARLQAYVDDVTYRLRDLSAAVAPSADPSRERLTRILKNHRIEWRELRALDLVALDTCREIATSRLVDELRDRCGEEAIQRARADGLYRSQVELSGDFAPIMTIAARLQVAGEDVGIVIAEVDMVGIWDVVNHVRVGETGYARLVTDDGTLIAHGNAEERRSVFVANARDPWILAGRTAGRYRDAQGRDVVGAGATLESLGWHVVVEQPVAEAFAAANVMQRDIILVVIGAALVALALGLGLGSKPVRVLEAMRAHARQIARGNLDARVPVRGLHELRVLAEALNDMAAELDRLHEEIRTKERLSTFARVAAGLAHDLQTPIESIRGACDVALSHPDDPTAQDLLRSAANNHLPRLHRYVRDLRRLAHDGKIPLELMKLDPRAIADQVIADAEASPKWQGVEFAAEGNAAPIWADESLLVRAMSNLVGNAADACVQRTPPQGRVVIALHDEDDGRSLVIEVTDTGVGIASDKLHDLLINDFKSTKRNSGVGLGLGVARHIAAAHGGAVTADSEEGVGSTFRIKLPRQTLSASDEIAPRYGGGAQTYESARQGS